MQTYGSDRVRVDGERITLTSRFDKGWTPRSEKTHTSAEFPGTAVLWEDTYYEVVFAEHLPQGVRYGLELWKESNTIRVSDRYDEESERVRIEEHRKKLRRDKQRKGANALAILVGHLPAHVQEAMASELGIVAARISSISIWAMFLLVASIALLITLGLLKGEGVAVVVIAAGAYFAFESFIRAHIVWVQTRPMGSVLGWISYALFHAITRKGPSPFAVPKGESIRTSDAPPDVAHQDALIMREGLFTLLPAADQQRIATRFGYDYRRESPKVAAIILIGSLIGVATSRNFTVFVAGALAVEQIYRILSFRRGPAGSVLGFLVRPFVRKFL